MQDINTNRKSKMMSDYIPQLMELYPEVSKKDITRIIKTFLTNFISLAKSNASIFIRPRVNIRTEGYMLLYNGVGTYSVNKAVEIKRRLMIKKIRIKYRLLNRKWNGYYYFSLTDRGLAKLLAQKVKNANNKKYYVFSNIILYKIFEEWLVQQHAKHIFRIPYVVEFGLTSWKKDFKCRDFEYIYRVEADGLHPTGDTVTTRCDNSLFNSTKDFVKLKWIDKDLISKKKNKCQKH